MSDLPSPALATTPDALDATPDPPLETLAAFVQTLAQWGNVRAAAQQVGVSRAHLYRMRRASNEFRILWDAALVLARPQVEEVLADRALNGVQETVFYHGEEVATRTRHDARLLLAHLARLDRIEDRGDVAKAAQAFDTALDRLLNPPVLLDWDDEEYEDYAEEDYEDDDDAVADAGDEGFAEADEDGYVVEDEATFIARLRGTSP